jgi:NAD(P)-dependent dehydrogenase (short-subunit alcohol dehydrogenase family)
MAGRLSGKVAIVTGAAPQEAGVGNGSAIAMLFAREGAQVLLVNRTINRAQELQQTIEQEGGICSVCPADVSHASEVQQMVETAIERYGRLDILVNNAGRGGQGTVETVTEDTWDNLIEVNLTGTMLCCKYSIPYMRQAGGGSIINISTGVAVLGIKRKVGFAAYAASKAGVHGLTLSMAADFAVDAIRVNCIVVGTVWTPMVARFGEAVREQRRRSVPLKTEGTGWDVGWAAVYLASDESRWVTGASIPVDGGLLAIRESASQSS